MTGRARMTGAAALVALLGIGARPAAAYIDPGTGGAVFGSIAPIIGLILVFFLGTLRWTWVYIKRGAAFLWRHKLAVAAALAALIVLGFLLARSADAAPAPARSHRRDALTAEAPDMPASRPTGEWGGRTR